MASTFNVGTEWSLESDREHSLVVRGTRQPYIPECRTGHPDNWSPAEGGELEDLEVYAVYGGRERRLPRSVEDRLTNDERFIEKVQQALEGD